MAIDEFGKSVPSLTPLDDDAAALLEGFGAEIQAREFEGTRHTEECDG